MIENYQEIIQKDECDDSYKSTYSTELKALEDAHGRFVEFDLITSDVDQSSQSAEQLYDDLITPEAIKSAETQLKGSIIGVLDPAHTKDFTELIQDGAKYGGVGHDHLLVSQNVVPALIIEKASAVDNNTKLRVTARINEYSARADSVWAMIKNKVLKGASIEYKETKKHYKEIQGKIVRVIDDLILGGFALTAKPRNASCAVSGWFVKALPSDSPLPVMENIQTTEPKMAIETKTEAPVEVVAPEAPKYDEQIKALVEEMKALKADRDTMKKELEQVKALESDKKLIDELSGKLKEEIKSALDVEQKQLVEADQKKFEEQFKSSTEAIKAARSKGIDEMWKVAREEHSKLGASGLI